MTSYCIVFVTTPPGKKARGIAEALLRDRLAACVNVIPLVRSSYWWKGKLTNDKESILVVKTKKRLLSHVIKKVREIHPYKVPEIIAVPIDAGFRPYLSWINTETKTR